MCIMHTSLTSTYAKVSESTVVLYVGMARKKHGRPYISIASDKLKSLVIYTYKL